MSYTPNKNLNLPVSGSLNWDVPLNNNESLLDTALSGFQTINLTSFSGYLTLTNTFPIVTTPLTAMSYIPLFINLTGSPSGTTTIVWPTGITGQWTVINNTTGSAVVHVQQGATFFPLATGSTTVVGAGGSGVFQVSGALAPGVGPSVGDVKFTASSSAQPLWLLCYGQAVSRTTYAALFSAIGIAFGAGDGSTTFSLPDARGIVPGGLDNMGGAAANRIPALNSIGALFGEANHVLSVAELAAHGHPASDSGHGHGVIDPGHFHGGVLVSGPTGWGSGTAAKAGNTSTNGTNITIATGYANINIGASGSSYGHNTVQPTMGFNVLIYAGV